MAEIEPVDLSQFVSTLFSTLFVCYDWADNSALNQELEALLLELEQGQSNKSVNRSNAGGWQSGGNLMTLDHPAIRQLKQQVEILTHNLTDQIIRDDGKQRAFRLVMDGWGNINRRGDYNVVHIHPNCMWSGCYYINPGHPDPTIPQNGLLELLDPREAANYIQIPNTILDGRQFIPCLPGRMLIWPSWLKHMVHPYQGEGERISIAYNINIIEERP
ncbi:MAG: TIGR02466 family protein [SAR86 cluster bacterium]|jgi:uncharacterized protein (TIGR02466 family)|uniref:Uncharacterized protein n=1 Tax=SAR86 cluster bacterium TaxID=2030880 RepID=A0A972VUG6_9GAMM|nr:hypothetical protein [SAR86 cluster bacterium]|tara:strand:- start:5571 stop:6221 length:651 start_codon:yes stop_codon:yes gene_type:complete